MAPNICTPNSSTIFTPKPKWSHGNLKLKTISIPRKPLIHPCIIKEPDKEPEVEKGQGSPSPYSYYTAKPCSCLPDLKVLPFSI